MADMELPYYNEPFNFDGVMIAVSQYSHSAPHRIHTRVFEFHSDWSTGLQDAANTMFTEGCHPKRKCNESFWVVPGTWIEGA